MGTTAAQDFTAVFGAHAGQETMYTFMHSVFGLVGSFDHLQ